MRGFGGTDRDYRGALSSIRIVRIWRAGLQRPAHWRQFAANALRATFRLRRPAHDSVGRLENER